MSSLNVDAAGRTIRPPHNVIETKMSLPEAIKDVEDYFSNYKEDILPHYEQLIRVYCQSEEISDEVASILEDIGQEFIWFSDLVNEEIKRRRDAAQR